MLDSLDVIYTYQKLFLLFIQIGEQIYLIYMLNFLFSQSYVQK